MRLKPSIAACLAACSAWGCWAHVGVVASVPPPPGPDSGEAIVLRVDDAGVLWGDGRLGDEIQRGLLASGRFTQVHYPVVPRNPPALDLHVEVTGNLDEYVAWGIVASAATGFFLFAPAPVMPYFTDLGLSGRATLSRRGQPLQQFPIEAVAHVTHAIFAPPAQFRVKARQRVYAAVANQVLAQLARLELLPATAP